eukprot:2886426-Lingulodinium_polyedra.AAC.1
MVAGVATIGPALRGALPPGAETIKRIASNPPSAERLKNARCSTMPCAGPRPGPQRPPPPR